MAQGWRKDYSRYRGFFLNILSVYNSKPNLRIYLELMLSLGTIVLFSAFAIKPTILTIIEINNEIKSKEETLTKLQKKIVDLRSASSLLQRESENLNLIDQAVPNNTELEKIIEQLETTATNSGVTIGSIGSSELLLKGSLEKTKTTNETKPLPEGANELPITITARGDYPNLMAFSKAIENLRRPIRIDTYLFSASKSIEETKILTLTINGRFPYLINTETIKENEK